LAAKSLKKKKAESPEQAEVPAPPSEFQELSSTGNNESMVFTVAELYGEEDAKEKVKPKDETKEKVEPKDYEEFMTDWISENMAEYKDFKKKVHEYTKIYNMAGEILKNYHGKERISKEALAIVHYALDIRKTYLGKLQDVYAKSEASLSGLGKRFEERVSGQYRARYMALFNRELDSLKKMSRTKPEYEDSQLARRLKYQPKADRETTLPAAEQMQERANELREKEIKTAKEQFKNAVELLKDALDSLTTAQNRPHLKMINAELAKISRTIQGGEGKVSKEASDNIVAALRHIRAGLEEEIAARRREQERKS
jgi:hypothetical protein